MREVSVWNHVSANVPLDGPGVLPEGLVLPDDTPGTPRWIPGQADGARLAYGRVVLDDEAAQHVAARMAEELRTRTPESARRLYDALAGSDPVTYVDRVLELVPGFGVSPDSIYDLGRRLVTESRDRAPVKVGITLFGFFEAGRHVNVVLVLGRHPEFTMYAAQAFRNGLSDPEPVIWQLARLATGWGRIAAVRSLARDPDRPDVRNWILRSGFRNSVGEEYLALSAATAGRLAAWLAEHGIDEELLDAGADITRGLLRGGPYGGMDQYEEGAWATGLLVRHLRRRASTPAHALALRDIEAFVRAGGDWTARAARGWTPDLRERLASTCAEILAGPGWADVVSAGLKSPDPSTFRRAAEAARLFSVDPVPALVQHLEREPLDVENWHHVMASVEEERIDDVVALASSRLPLSDMASGPAVLFGGEPEYPAYASLDVLLAGLVKWPGRGWALVRAGLCSPLVRSRNLALRVLHTWGKAAWPLGVDQVLRSVAEREPEPEVRRRIEQLLAGEPVQDGVTP